MKYWIAIIIAVLITLGGILGTSQVEGQELPTEEITIIETIIETVPGPTETITVPGPTSTETVTIVPPRETVTETETIRLPGDTVTETETVFVSETERAIERETETTQPTDEPQPSPVATETETENIIEPPQVITRFVERFEKMTWWQLTLFALAGTLISGAVYYFGWRDRAADESNFISNIIDAIRRR